MTILNMPLPFRLNCRILILPDVLFVQLGYVILHLAVELLEEGVFAG